ncbi:Copper amine oxidase N-terminal domain-containing protein [Paenibacillus uliginis N3/975]|uniref:Copper amine oxidase N-terminal domain-containing protein n=1 Tax=Paenibacillus uliginis N3/975 TaxID=1313296 RepID=A0A1X7HNH6_9BACL|nr:copper amine oxidase N-terminal domain-containing protein [Paenibacillus uliginis]SMF89812.1 Copper amine oxidase N-terminal domain-containing protein [Paenibacillus uliginis N3/975]
MRKFWAAMLSALLIFPMLFQSQAQAAVKFNILIDGVRLTTSQAPVMIQGRVMLPMRAIFEALDAKVKWNQKTQTVTAVRDNTKIVLKINSKTATINNKSVRLDVPAKNLKGATMVPVRFVSESLGEKVGWNSKTKTVSITTTSNGGRPVPVPDTGLSPASNVTVRDIANNGDGRDLQVSFSKSYTESRADQYRVMIVKAEKSYNFNQSAARMVPSSNYSVVFPTGSNNTVTLTSGARDVDGDYIRENQAYKAYVLTAGRYNGEFALSSPSSSITLSNTNAVETATNVKGNDVNDYGDGRDLSVSFTRAQKEDLISNYRIMVVKTKDVSKFDLAAAKSVPSQYYTTVYKTSGSGTTLTNALSSSTRDTSGEYIKNGVPYTLFVMSVSSNENTLASKLSSGSSSITLATGSTTAPVITQVTDVSNYGDGRDLRVNFNKLSDESGIGSYRIFVVKSSDYHNFNLNKANSVSSSNYTQVNKTGYNITQTLSSGARDVDGSSIRNGVYYRVFVMSVGSGNNYGNNNLSSVSSDIILSNNNSGGSYVGSVSNLYVRDVSDNNDGRDLEVSFNRPSDENNISHYRAFVVKSNKAGNFDLYDANSNSYYTDIYKTGYSNIIKPLSNGSRDTDGDSIRNGVSYRVFILSVGNGNYSGNNALSSSSSIITLSGNSNVNRVYNLNVKDIGDASDAGDGRDMQISFDRPSDENNISEYRAFVVKSSKAGSFDLYKASNLSSYYYTRIDKTGYSKITQSLLAGSRDTDGDYIRNGVKYDVFIMSVGYGNYSSNNALSSSYSIELSNKKKIDAVSRVTVEDVSDYGDGRDLKVSFPRTPDYNNISYYRIFVVKASQILDPTTAKSIGSGKYTDVTNKADSTIQKTLDSNAKDVDGADIKPGLAYRVYVMSVGGDSYNGSYALSPSSDIITLKSSISPVNPVTDLKVSDDGDRNDGRDMLISFKRLTDEDSISQYQIYVVKSGVNFKLPDANNAKFFTTVNKKGSDISTSLSSNTTDIDGKEIRNSQPYQVYVLSVSKDGNPNNNALSEAQAITLKGSAVSAPLNVKAQIDGNNTGFDITFEKSLKPENVGEYRVMVLPFDDAKSFGWDEATQVPSDRYKKVDPKGELKVNIELGFLDVDKQTIVKNKAYKVYVLAVNNGQGADGNALSNFAKIEITDSTPDSAQATNVTALIKETDSKILQVKFKAAANKNNISSYEIMLVPESDSSFDPKKAAASKTAAQAITKAAKAIKDVPLETGTDYLVDLEMPTQDSYETNIVDGKYKVYVLSVNKNTNREVKAVSTPSIITLKAAEPATPVAPAPQP